MENLTEEDEGKNVVTMDGETIGVVSDVEGGRAHVDPDPGIAGKIKSTLGWDDADEDDYVLDENQIDAVTDDEIRLRE